MSRADSHDVGGDGRDAGSAGGDGERGRFDQENGEGGGGLGFSFSVIVSRWRTMVRMWLCYSHVLGFVWWRDNVIISFNETRSSGFFFHTSSEMGARKRKYSDEHDSAGYSVSIPGSTSWPVNAGPIQAPPPKKRARTKKDPDAPPPEKRGAGTTFLLLQHLILFFLTFFLIPVFKKRCPQNIMERVERVMSQR
jgi:hypothetical protein